MEADIVDEKCHSIVTFIIVKEVQGVGRHMDSASLCHRVCCVQVEQLQIPMQNKTIVGYRLLAMRMLC